jgi:thiol:disulfide interchange protein DsbD
MRVPCVLALLFAAALGVWSGAACAASSDAQTSPRMTARLISDTEAVAPGQSFHVALQLTPAPGWHSYWHNPGDAGAATSFDVTAPGLTEAGIAWPLPQRIVQDGITSFGYDTPVLLTRAVTVAGPGPVALTAEAHWLVCRTVCVPEHATFHLTLPTGTPAPSIERPLFDEAAAAVPGPARWPAHIAPDGTLWLTGLGQRRPALFLPDAPDTTLLGAAQPAHWRNGMLTLKLRPTASFKADAAMTGVLVLGDGGQRTGYRLTATPAALPQNGGGLVGLPLTLLLGFAGGLLLNLMPCVFPVLAMKAVSLSRLGGAARGQVRREALAYSAGVLASVLALAGVLLVLRAAGAAAGWGFQFQWPAFVAAMAWLFFAVGLNLSGVFTLGGGWTGIGQSLAARGGTLGSFATGLLAVLVATPCTAPFMGVAIATAIAAPAVEALAVFAALGVGLALPALLLAVVPRLASRLPAPGAWMEHLRQGLAFPMYAAAVWLVWVLSRQSGSSGVLGVSAGFVLIALATWVARFGRPLALICLLGAAAILPAIGGAGTPTAIAEGAQPYSAATLLALRASGRPVLVDMTASWCVTCLINERVALRPAMPRLAAHGVAYLTGDWTRQDAGITAFLRQYGREGVPLYVFFAAGLPVDQPGRVLPQILTPGLVASLLP